ALQLHANSSPSKTQPLNPLASTFSTDHDNETFFVNIVYPLISGTILVPILALETVQRYWQTTNISPIRNTNARRRADKIAEKERNGVHVNAEEGAANYENDDEDDDIDNPDDESSPNFVREPCRYRDASLFSKITFSWIDPLLFKGYRAPLESEDVWDLDDDDKANSTLRKWEPFKRSAQTLLFSLLDFFKYRIAHTFSMSFLSSILDLGRPYFLFYLVRFLETRTGNDPNENFQGVLLLLGLLGTLLFKVISDGYLFFEMRRSSIRLRSLLISEIYGKAMRRAAGGVKSKSTNDDSASGDSSQQDQKANIGKIVSLMSNEVNRVYGFFYQSHYFVVQLPLNATLSIFALFFVLGPSALAGLLILLASSPVATYLSSKMMNEQNLYSDATDYRTQVVNEALQGIRIIKYFAWENEFIKKINKARDVELGRIKGLWMYLLGFWTVAWSGSILFTFFSFFFYCVVFGNKLDAATAFTSLTLLKIVSNNLNMLPMIGMHLFRAKASLDRVADFLDEDELDKYDGKNAETGGDKDKSVGKGSVRVNESTPLLSDGGNASVDAVVNVYDDKPDVQLPDGCETPIVGTYKAEFEYYGSGKEKSKSVKLPTSKSKITGAVEFVVASYNRVKELFVKKKDDGDEDGDEDAKPAAVVNNDVLPFELRDITARFPVGGLTTIIGPTGSGKTSMLLALLGEMKRKQGFCFFPDPRLRNPSVAYAAQTAFILNATVRENILFGCEFDEARYHQVIEACALVRDLEILEGGDMTEIGEKY
ncbi:hypothetical protein HDU76_009027, partial [Blyttiomyces sp. JEL0837]